MKQLIITCNAGSANIKLAAYEQQNIELCKKIQVETIEQALSWLKSLKGEKILAIGHRIVHGGETFKQPEIITRDVVKELMKLIPLAPLHQPQSIELIKAVYKLYPDITQVGCFDTAFHKTTPRVEKLTGLPLEYFNEGIERYGFHGISYEYIASALSLYDVDAHKKRVIVAHLGGGSSMCALYKLQSLATTMGFSTLEGMLMNTRCGSLDPGVVLYLLQQKKMKLSEVTDVLYNQSGLFGISGISGDMQTLLQSKKAEAKQAIDLYCYMAAKQLGSLIAISGGLDMLVFTGGIGENSPEIRQRICQYFKWLGLNLNLSENNKNATQISAKDSQVAVHVIPTNEEYIIAQSTVFTALL